MLSTTRSLLTSSLNSSLNSSLSRNSLSSLSLLSNFRPLSTNSATSSALAPALSLNDLTYMPGSQKQKRRVGRGVGSGRGKTCGRGHKGRRARSGGTVKLGFEGGQTPFWRRVPKRGFTPPNQKPLETVSLNKIETHVAMGRLSQTGSGEDGRITMKDLLDSGVVTKIKHGVKLVASDRIGPHYKRRALAGPGPSPSRGYGLAYPLDLEVTRASRQAIEAVEAAGGRVTAAHYNRLGLRALLKPDKFGDDGALLPRRARPPPKMREYYTRFENRGYLSVEAQLEAQLRRLGVEGAVDFDAMRRESTKE
eukprot:CAMPEP_0182464682 /NCGR_PEP_ID=MMETSP1319-20130603/8778_1 /TAXON_ID=172717 /ORGANISM="Bolidomonas pacifica, Strain RCC208" /LENGTH=307 /DNA_ID=CAMNT_0024664341 /DNA_START=141 /DNA_END=1064 /DNA_ORIENTATION=-